MSKIELSGTSGGYNISAINENFQTIEEVLNDKVLWRDNPGNASNVMNNHLDMNGFLILNTPSLGGGGGGGGTPGEGGNGTDGFSNAIIYAYQRSATLPSGKPGAIVYEFSSHMVVTPPTNELANGWTKAIPEGSDPLYVCVVTASGQNATDSIADFEWSSPVILAKDGVSALNSASVFVYQRTPTNAPPALPSASCTYTFSSGVLLGLNNGWTSTIPPSFNGGYLWCTTASAASLTNSDTIAPSEWAAGQLMAQDGLDGMNGGADGLNNGTFYAYKRADNMPVDNPGAVTYHFPSASITTPSTDALANGWFKKPPVGSNQLYMVVASASSSLDTDEINANEWTAPASVGANGMNTATVYAYQRTASATAPVKPTANVTYDFTTKLVSGLTQNWSAAIPAASAGMYLWIITATAASIGSSDIIPSSEWATPQILSKDGTNGTNGTNGTSGTNGTRGTVQIAYAISGSSWSDSTADLALIAAGYYPAQNRDIVTLYNSGNNFSQSRFYDNGVWSVLTSYIDGNLLVNGTMSATKVSADMLTGQTYRTAASGTRVIINESGNNAIKAYDGSGNMVASLGGLAGGLITVMPTGGAPGIGVSTQGYGSGINITGISTALTALNTYQNVSANLCGGYGGAFTGATAIYADGVIEQAAWPETSNKGIKANNVNPVTDNVYYCGTLAKRWAGVTSSTALLVSSDARLKTDVKNTELGLRFINSLRPVSYRLIEGRKDITRDADDNAVATSVAGVRTHYGLIAQEVKEALMAAGDPNAALWAVEDPTDPESQQALRYEELISPLIAAIQELSFRVVQLEAQVNNV